MMNYPIIPIWRTVIGDGNCFYRSVLSSMNLNEEWHLLLRSAAMQYFNDHHAEYAEWYPENDPLAGWQATVNRHSIVGDYV
jgi:hypothetical protein